MLKGKKNSFEDLYTEMCSIMQVHKQNMDINL